MKKLFWIPVLLFVLSCEKDADPGLPVDSVIEVEIAEISVDGEEVMILSGKTRKEYSCSNYIINHSTAYGEEAFSITFEEVVPDPEGRCFTALGPARAQIILGALENGVYELSLNSGPFTNRGTLEVSDTEIILNFPQQNGIEVLTPVVLR